MARSKFLDYEVALLLAKYGKSAVLGSLAKQIELTPDQLDAFLQNISGPKPTTSHPRKPSLRDLVKQLSQEQPSKAEALRILLDRLEKRTFLPELRDVRRFFDQHGHSAWNTKSRSESLPRVLKLLAELDLNELEGLCQVQHENTRSSLGLISDEILRRDR